MRRLPGASGFTLMRRLSGTSGFTLMRRLSGTSGFTLMELVIAMALGMVVLLAAFTVIDRAFFANKAVSDREDALQRGRNTLEQMTRQLRSQVCVAGTNPITYADGSTVKFYMYMGDPTASGTQNPEWHTLAYSGGTITEQDYKVTQVSPSITVAGSPYRTVKLTNVAQARRTDGTSIPIFQYWKYDTSGALGTGAMQQLTALPLSSSDQGLVAKISVDFVVRPTGIASTDPHSTAFQDDVLWRSPEPDSPATLPCAPTS